MKRILFLSLSLISISTFAQQENEHKKKDKEKMERFIPSITRTLGASLQQFDGLNARVANLPQYKQLKDYTATIGLGWMKEMDRFVSDAGVTLGSSMSGHRDERSSTIHYIGLNADMGYDLLKSEHITFYPLAGLGYQWYRAIFYKDNSAVDFDNVLGSPAVQNSIRSVSFRNGFVTYRAGLGIAFKSLKYPSSSIGLQAGYTGSFQKQGWKSSEGQTLSNAPEDRISQFYISLVLTSKPWMMMKK